MISDVDFEPLYADPIVDSNYEMYMFAINLLWTPFSYTVLTCSSSISFMGGPFTHLEAKTPQICIFNWSIIYLDGKILIDRALFSWTRFPKRSGERLKSLKFLVETPAKSRASLQPTIVGCFVLPWFSPTPPYLRLWGIRQDLCKKHLLERLITSLMLSRRRLLTIIRM